MIIFFAKNKWNLLAFIALLFTLCSRLIQPDWYADRQFHPDERWLISTVTPLVWPELPGKATGDSAGLQYGSFPLYMVAAAKSIAAMMGYANTLIVARSLTGIVDTLSVLLIFALGVQLYNRGVAAITATFVAFTPLHIQLSHFFSVDPWVALFAIVTLYACAKIYQTQSFKWSIVSGLGYAFALACKTGALPLALPIVIAHYWHCFDASLTASQKRRAILQATYFLITVGLISIIAFLIIMPIWSADDWEKFFQNQSAQQDILVKGAPDGVPFVRQYWDTNWFFHIRNLVLYYQGYLLGTLSVIAVFSGILAIIVTLEKKLNFFNDSKNQIVSACQAHHDVERYYFASVLIVSWIVPYYIIIGIMSFAKFARYLLPILPFLALLAAAFIDQLAIKFSRNKAVSRLVKTVTALSIIITSAFGVAYIGTYLKPHPWIETSEWMLNGGIATQITENGISRKTVIYNETWADDLPIDVKAGNTSLYDNRKLNIVEWDSLNKLDEIVQTLSQADVIILADSRGYGTYLRQQFRFPLTYAYYEILMTQPEMLGFSLAHQSYNHIKLFGFIALNDSRILTNAQWNWADESFTLYDRPHAFIFKKNRIIAPQQLKSVLEMRVKALNLPDTWRIRGAPDENLRHAAMGKRVNPNLGTSRGKSIALFNPVLTWWLLITFLGILALPLCKIVFKNFPDQGYSFSKALGLLLFSWISYNITWLNLLPFYQSSLWLVLLCLSVPFGIIAYHSQRTIKLWISSYRKEIIVGEILFSAPFFIFIIIRSFSPNIHDLTSQGYFGGGEPLGITYLNAVTRSSTFPVYNPWLALHDASYYYFGYVLVATLTKLSGFLPAITYNLSLALFFALTLQCAYGICRALVEQRVFAIAGALAVACFGSLNSIYVLMSKWHEPGQSFFNAWFSQQMIWDTTRFPELAHGHIFEFPFFSYLYGDLHPHSMVICFSLVLTGLLLVPFKSVAAGLHALGDSKFEMGIWIILVALLLDAQYAINAWSWPIFVVLSASTLTVALWGGKSSFLPKQKLSMALLGFCIWLVVLLLGRLLFYGFHHYFEPNSASRIGLVSSDEWSLVGYIPLAYFGFGLIGLIGLAGLRLVDYYMAKDDIRQSSINNENYQKYQHPFEYDQVKRVVPSVVLVFCMIVFFTLFNYGPIIALGLLLLVIFSTALYCHDFKRGEEAFLWIVAVVVMVIISLGEIIYISDRVNTLFKFWINGWVLLSLLFAAGFSQWIETLQLKSIGKQTLHKDIMPPKVIIGMVSLAIILLFFLAAKLDVIFMGKNVVSYYLIVTLLIIPILLSVISTRSGVIFAKAMFTALSGLGLIYPIGAAVAKLHQANMDNTNREGNPRLDGIAFLREGQSKYDAEAIDWLNTHVDKTEVLLELPGLEMYQDYSRYSIYTGLPTILGWRYQIEQQLGNHNAFLMDTRINDALQIYSTSDVEEAKSLLNKYKIHWIVVGNVERREFDKMKKNADFSKFNTFCDEVFRNNEVNIYRFN